MEAATICTRDHASLLAAALREHRAGRHGAATALCNRILAEDPDAPAALYVAALVEVAIDKRVEARNHLARLVVLRPNVAEAEVALARVLALEGENAAAFTHYQRAHDLKPKDAGIVLAYANALLARGEPNQAIAELRAALRHSPGIASLHEALGDALLATHETGEAEICYRRALELAPDLPLAWLGLARVFLARDRAFDAISAVDHILVFARSERALAAEAWFLRGTAQKALLNYPEAIADLLRAIAAEPSHVPARLNLGNALAACERWQEAEQLLREARALAPLLQESEESLGSLLLRRGSLAEAEAIYRHVLAAHPESIVAHQNLAAICAASDRAEEAVSHRNTAYRKRSVFVEPAGQSRITVLMPVAAAGGSVPIKFLFPRDHSTLIKWFIAYAKKPEDGVPLPYDLVFNGIGDADFAETTDGSLQRFLDSCRAPVLNLPVRVAATRRDRVPSLLAGIPDLVIPPIFRLDLSSPSDARTATASYDSGITFPALLRLAGSHGGQSVRLLASFTTRTSLRSSGAMPAYLSRFVPYRSEDGYFRKYRVIFVDRKPYPYHLALSRRWLVHYVTADMLTDPAKCTEEKRFLGDPEAAIGSAAMAALRTIGERLDLDFAGADFAILPDGKVLLFEANATMLVHPEKDPGPLSYKNSAVRLILHAFSTLIEQRCSPTERPAQLSAVRTF